MPKRTPVVEQAPAVQEDAPTETETSEGGSTLPPAPHTLTGPAKERVAIWARQSKSNTIALCSYKEGEGECYYPLNPVRDPAHNNDPKVVEKNGKKGILHTCSWHPEAHGEQIVFPPKKEDEI